MKGWWQRVKEGLAEVNERHARRKAGATIVRRVKFRLRFGLTVSEEDKEWMFNHFEDWLREFPEFKKK